MTFDVSPQNLVAQLLGIAGTYMLFSLYQQKDRRHLLWRKLLADVLWCAHYICLGAFAGAIPNGVGVLREAVFLQEKKRWAHLPIWPCVFILIGWGIAIATWKSPLSILPMGASTLVTFSLWLKNPRATKLLCIPVCITFAVYDAFVGSYAGILNESISLISIIIWLCRYRKPSAETKVSVSDVNENKSQI